MLVFSCRLFFCGCLILVASTFVAADDAPAARSVEVDSFELSIPEAWKQTQPSPAQRRFRKAQFEIPKADGDADPAELVIYHFGPQGGGGVDANLQRWIGQFDASGRKAKKTSGESPLGEYVLVDIAGTYNKPIGPPIRQQTQPMPGARMLGVILHAKEGGNYFFKLTGPEKTVTGAVDGLRASFGAKADSEQDYE